MSGFLAQVVAAICLPTSNVGHYELPMRFTSIVRLAYMSYPPRSELEVLAFTVSPLSINTHEVG